MRFEVNKFIFFLFVFLLLITNSHSVFAQADNAINASVPDEIKRQIKKCEADPDCYRKAALSLEPILNRLPDDKNPLIYRRSSKYLFYKC